MNALRPGACVLAAALCVAACTVGPDYRRPPVDIPTSFKEGAAWQRAEANPQGALASTWWLAYQDDALARLVEDALAANQTIVAAEAAYRFAQATVAASSAMLYPTVTAGMSASRGSSGRGLSGTNSSAIGTGTGAGAGGASSGVSNVVTASLGASWEPDLWGQIRRGIESSKDSAQATDAQLAGVRLSIASAVAIDYFGLRQLDMDIAILQQQRALNARILEMTRASFQQGTASNDMVLAAEDTLQLVVALLQASEMSREQFEHAIAVLAGKPPASFSIPPQPGYGFTVPAVPLVLPSELLQRRYDVVAAERLAASANERIGVAEAAFFPSLLLSAQGGFQGSALATLFSLPNRIWTLGPALAATLFDGGARTAAVHQAQAIYDQDVATYRQTVLAAFQSVEDSLSACKHLRAQADAYADIYRRNQLLLESQRAQLAAGTASEQTVLMQQLTLLSAELILRQTQGQLVQGSVTLVMNLGGGWQWDGAQAEGKPLTSSRTSP